MIGTEALRKRIDGVAVLLDPEVEMGPGGKAASAYTPNNVTDSNATAGLDGNLRQVSIEADDSALVRDTDASPEFAAPPGRLYPSVRHRTNGRTVMGNEVNAGVRPVDVQERMVPAFAEARRNVVELEREAQRLRSERLAVAVIKVRLPPLVPKSKGVEGLVADTNLRSLEPGRHT